MEKGTIHIELEGEEFRLEVKGNMGFVTAMEVMMNALHDMIEQAIKDDFEKNKIAKFFAKKLEEIFPEKSEEKNDKKGTPASLC